MSNALVSIVMPVWRPRPEWLLAAVESVLAQRECVIELIVVDDGNQEPVAPLLGAVSDQRLRVLSISHAGEAGARNAGLAAARGTHVRYFDSDDVMPPRSTAHLLALAGDDQVIAYGATQFCDENLRPKTLMTSDVTGDAVTACLLGRFNVRCPAMLFPRTVTERAGPWRADFGLSEDWDYVLRAVEYAPVVGSAEVVLHYRRHPGSLSRRATIAAGEEAWSRVMGGYFERHPEQRGSSLERKAKAALRLDKAVAYARSGERREAVSRLARALPLDPVRTVATGFRLLARSPLRFARRLLRRAPAQPRE